MLFQNMNSKYRLLKKKKKLDAWKVSGKSFVLIDGLSNVFHVVGVKTILVFSKCTGEV